MSKYANMQANRIVPDGGSVRVTLDSDGAGQGHAGVSLPCKGCWVCPEAANSAVAYVNIGVAASSDLGMELPESDTGGPLFINIDDVAKLHFYGQENDVIDVLYLLG